MKGFKDFVLRGNLVELAVAFVMAAAFATVITATVGVLLDLIGKLGDIPDFSDYQPNGVSIGAWLNAVIAFLLMAAVVYFFIVLPYTRARERLARKDSPAASAVPSEDIALLTEIRDLLRERSGQP